MWTRKNLKERAKQALKRNYWKAVLVSLLLLLLGSGISSSPSAMSSVDATTSTTKNEMVTENSSIIEEVNDVVSEMSEMNQADADAVIAAYVITFLVFFLIVFGIAVLFSFFLYNPLVVGTQRFMLKSVEEKGEIKELAYAFDHNYKNNVKTMFFRDLRVFLWALLFVIPGIYKKYQYYMVEYILAENPDMPYKEVLERSRQMMQGQKWKTFVLELSFLWWEILGVFTCGILQIFYIMPYKQLTRAALYLELTGRTPETMETIEMQTLS